MYFATVDMLLYFSLLKFSIPVLQIKGKYFIRIDPIGEGARWRRTAGQEIYSPLIFAFAEQVNKVESRNVCYVLKLVVHKIGLFLLFAG